METQSSCQICLSRQPNAGNDLSVVFEDQHWLVRHSKETNLLGYLVVESKRHFLDLSQCTKAETSSYGPVLSMVMTAVRTVIDCERIYTFTLAEMVPHFHVHVIPRTSSMPRAYKGRGIMSYPLKPVADKALVDEVCSRLRRALAGSVAAR